MNLVEEKRVYILIDNGSDSTVHLQMFFNLWPLFQSFQSNIILLAKQFISISITGLLIMLYLQENVTNFYQMLILKVIIPGSILLL